MKTLTKAIGSAAVLLLAVSGSAVAEHGGSHGEQNVVEVAASAGTFTTLTELLEAADLVGVLQTGGPYTVFAPTDEAFAKLPDGMLDKLMKERNKDKLVELLSYHVVPGKYTAEEVVARENFQTINSHFIDIDIETNGNVRVDDKATIIATDVEASNGVIHVIDEVLIPLELKDHSERIE